MIGLCLFVCVYASGRKLVKLAGPWPLPRFLVKNASYDIGDGY